MNRTIPVPIGYPYSPARSSVPSGLSGIKGKTALDTTQVRWCPMSAGEVMAHRRDGSTGL